MRRYASWIARKPPATCDADGAGTLFGMSVPATASEAADLLGIGIDASADAVRERYRSLARVYHPDRNPDDEAAGERMLELNAAVDLLLGSDAPTVERILEPAEPQRALTRREQRREAAIREALHDLPYGVYVIGTVTADGQANAMVADWVMQVSFKPRILAVAFERDASSLRNVRDTRQLSVSLLPEEGMDLAARFLQPSDPSKIKGRPAGAGRIDKMRGVAHRRLEGGAPVLDDALCWIACEAQQFVPIGGHVLVLARVIDGARELREGAPLTSTYTGWAYGG